MSLVYSPAIGESSDDVMNDSCACPALGPTLPKLESVHDVTGVHQLSTGLLGLDSHQPLRDDGS